MNFENERISYLSLTPNAKEQIKALLSERELEIGKRPAGIRLALKPKGCSGMKYDLEFAEEGVNISKYDDLFVEDDILIFLDPKISMWVVGTMMDYENDGLNSGFIFKNPNEKGQCGCGESFYV